MTLLKQGDLVTAGLLVREAWDSSRRTLGGDHASTLASAAVLSQLLRRQGDLAAARSLIEEALADVGDSSNEQVLALTVPLELNLALVMKDSGSARALLGRSLANLRRALGDAHRLTIMVAGALLLLLRAQEDETAEKELLASLGPSVRDQVLEQAWRVDGEAAE
jgi:hypothetical protein